jgi:DNA end-binding protein Ku
MAARAIWKAVITIGTLEVPVKLYSAVTDRSVHFRLLHRTDKAPVQQQLISSETEEIVERSEVRKALPIDRQTLVILDPEELQELEPEPDRSIEITRFVDPSEIDHRWYERPYYLGPDGDQQAYFAASQALEKKKLEGIARWVMRKKQYVGALRSEDGYLMLIALRHAEEVVSAENLTPPAGRALQAKEIAMAESLLASLEDEFDPAEFRDQYRARVMELVETKARGGKVKLKAFRPRATEDEKLSKALEASLAKAKRRKAGG